MGEDACSYPSGFQAQQGNICPVLGCVGKVVKSGHGMCNSGEVCVYQGGMVFA